MLTIFAIETSEIYGHGNRLVIWFSGCTLRCKGCINSNLWDKSAGKQYSVEKLITIILATKGISGVTFLGGEPLQQGQSLLEFSHAIIDMKLDIVLFTGYELFELDAQQKAVAEMAAVLITGRYVENQRDTRLLLRGSRNQQIIIREKILEKYYKTEARQVEVEITPTEDKFLGFPEDFINEI